VRHQHEEQKAKHLGINDEPLKASDIDQ